jgi:hypothetical protein
MKITATNSEFLNDIYEELENKVELEKITQKVQGSKGDAVTYLAVANLTVTSLGVLFTYLRYLESQKNHYIHYRYKEDTGEKTRELKFDNLSKSELDVKLKNIQDRVDELELFHIG